MLESHEIINPILEMLKQIVADKRIESRVGITIFLGNSGGMDPEIIIRFKPFFSEEGTWAEMTVWQGFDPFAATVIIDAFHAPSGDSLLHEEADIKNLTEVQPFFEKIMSLYKFEATN